MDYFANEAVPGKRFFRCDRMRATLSVESCAGLFRRENDTPTGCGGTCRNCPLGAEHAGQGNASLSPIKGQVLCARCHRTAGRLLNRMVCISCYNREREVVAGRNAKGSAPVKTCRLEPRRLRYCSGGEVVTMSVRRSLDTDELVVAALRDSKQAVRFGFGAQQPRGVSQLRLF